MEDHFVGTCVVRLRSVHGTYLVANDDVVGLHRDGSHANARWTVLCYEMNQFQPQKVSLRSSSGRYLVRTEVKSPLGLTGWKVSLKIQPEVVELADWMIVDDSDAVVHIIFLGTMFLRANRGIPPWRNTVTVSYYPASRFMQHWLLWNAEVLERNPHQPVYRELTQPNSPIISSDPDEEPQNDPPGGSPADPSVYSTPGSGDSLHDRNEVLERHTSPITPSRPQVDPNTATHPSATTTGSYDPNERKICYKALDDNGGFMLFYEWQPIAISGEDLSAFTGRLDYGTGLRKLNLFIDNESTLQLTPLESRLQLDDNEELVLIADPTVPHEFFSPI